MAYTHKNYRTKKALKEDLAAGKEVTAYQPGPFGPNLDDGWTTLEGPHYPEPHRWYARAEVQDGRVVRIK